MDNLPAQQKGASAIVTMIVLVILGFSVYVGIQYAPQFMESKSIDSILKTIDGAHKVERIDDEQAAKTKLVGLLQINEMNDMSDSYKVKQSSNNITIEISYDRDLDLIYKTLPIHYQKMLILN